MKFQDFHISRDILKAIGDLGFEEPTPIQVTTIPLIMEGRDVTGQAQTGTGKTAAFAIPIIERINPASRTVQAMVLSPTRELAIQIAEEFARLARYRPKIAILPIYGGQSIERQLKALKCGVHIIIGTPGRVMDHLRRGTLSIDHVEMVVLDEADRMLDMGFLDDIRTILSETPESRQTLLFSATMPEPIIAISKKFQKNPKLVKVIRHEMDVPLIEQEYIELPDQARIDLLCKVLDVYNPRLALVFCNTMRGVDRLSRQLYTRGCLSEGIHGDMKQSRRDRVMSDFRSGRIDVLIATDVAARGIDIGEVDIVFNYDVPQDTDYYVHRIGRTGRAGRAGRAVTFVTPRDIFRFREIQKLSGRRITPLSLPADAEKEIEAEEADSSRGFLDRLHAVIQDGGLDTYLELVEREMGQGFTSLDIAAALLKIQLESPAGREPGRSRGQGHGEHAGEHGFVRLVLTVGRRQGVNAGDVVGAIANEAGIPGKAIGAIRIGDDQTLVDIPDRYVSQVMAKMADKSIRGYPAGISLPVR